jgi:hypothetical protein
VSLWLFGLAQQIHDAHGNRSANLIPQADPSNRPTNPVSYVEKRVDPSRSWGI